MKHTVPVLVNLMLICFASSAQRVNIPDTNFRNALIAQFPGCFNGAGQMDTTCIGVVTATSLQVSGLNIHDLNGVQYFKSLTQLDAGNNQLTALPSLPDLLKRLSVQNNALTNLPELPAGITYIKADSNNLSSLPQLPTTLATLLVEGNPNLLCLPKLPYGLQQLSYDTASVKCIPNMPANCTFYPVAPAVCNAANNANGCKAFPQVYGFVYNDNNSNNLYDAGDTPRAHVRMQLSNGVFSYSDVSGHFYLAADSLGSYGVSIFTPPYFTPVPVSNIHYFSSYANVVYDTFALQPAAVADSLAVFITPRDLTAQAGATFVYNVECINAGTDTLPTGISLKYDTSRLVFDSTSLPGIITASADSLLLSEQMIPGEVQTFVAYFHVKPTVLLGDTIIAAANARAITVQSTDTALTAITAYNPPNSKEGPQQILLSQVAAGWIEYVVRFQNTGADTVHDIVITDTLSPKLRADNLQLIQSVPSQCTTTIWPGGIITFEFHNIILPDSGSSQNGSKGLVRFSVRPDSTLQVGDVIDNSAGIRLNNDPGVRTNTMHTQVVIHLLPLKLISFAAKKEANVVHLQWLTTNEENVDRFEVERSGNGRDYHQMENGSHEYSFIDYSPLSGLNFYRLKMIDKDGRFEYSPVRVVNNSGSFYVSVYPNPVKDELQVNTKSDKKATVHVQVISKDGKTVLSTTWDVTGGSAVKTINTSALQKGSYFLRITSTDKEKRVVKFEKM